MSSGCQRPSDGGVLPATPTRSLQTPLDRIPVRVEVIQAAVPENTLVVSQGNHILNDVREAKVELSKTETVLANLHTELTKEKQETNKIYQSRINWIRLLCVLGIGAGIISSIFLSRKLIFVSLAAIITLAAIAIEAWIYLWALPVAGVALCVVLVITIYELWRKSRATKELVATVEQQKISNIQDLDAFKSSANKIQSNSTKKLVERFRGK